MKHVKDEFFSYFTGATFPKKGQTVTVHYTGNLKFIWFAIIDMNYEPGYAYCIVPKNMF